MQIRPACTYDYDGVKNMVAQRVRWMVDRGMRAHPEAATVMAGQTAEDDTPMWVLSDNDRVVGCTSTYTDSPEWGFTENERAIPALFLAY